MSGREDDHRRRGAGGAEKMNDRNKQTRSRCFSGGERSTRMLRGWRGRSGPPARGAHLVGDGLEDLVGVDLGGVSLGGDGDARAREHLSDERQGRVATYHTSKSGNEADREFSRDLRRTHLAHHTPERRPPARARPWRGGKGDDAVVSSIARREPNGGASVGRSPRSDGGVGARGGSCRLQLPPHGASSLVFFVISPVIVSGAVMAKGRTLGATATRAPVKEVARRARVARALGAATRGATTAADATIAAIVPVSVMQQFMALAFLLGVPIKLPCPVGGGDLEAHEAVDSSPRPSAPEANPEMTYGWPD